MKSEYDVFINNTFNGALAYVCNCESRGVYVTGLTIKPNYSLLRIFSSFSISGRGCRNLGDIIREVKLGSCEHILLLTSNENVANFCLNIIRNNNDLLDALKNLNIKMYLGSIESLRCFLEDTKKNIKKIIREEEEYLSMYLSYEERLYFDCKLLWETNDILRRKFFEYFKIVV